MDQLPRLGKRELICLLLFTCNYVVSVWRGFLFLWVLGMGYVLLLWHSLSLPYNYFSLLWLYLGNSQVSVYRPIGATLVLFLDYLGTKVTMVINTNLFCFRIKLSYICI